MIISKSKTLVFFVTPLKFFISHRLQLAIRAKESGYDVHVISLGGEGEEILIKKGIVFHKIRMSRGTINPFVDLNTIFQIYKIYKKIKPNIVHHVTIKSVLYGTLAARLSGVEAIVNAFSGLGYVFTAKGLKAFILRNAIILAYQIILNRKKIVSIIQNIDDMNYLLSKSIIKKDQTILIKGSGVCLTEFTHNQEPDGIPVVILPARLLIDKGVGEFVEAAKLLHKDDIKIRMVLVGDIDLGNPSSISNLDLSKWCEQMIVEHWGFCSKMSETISKSNIVCLPSYREGLPKSLIEATACGRAIITTDVPGCREMIDYNAPNGILIPIKNSFALADAIKKLIYDPKKRYKMGLNGRKMAEREFSIDLVVNQTLDIYKSLLK